MAYFTLYHFIPSCIFQSPLGNGIRQIYHASSACLLANNTVTRHGEGKVARWAVAFDRLLEDVTGLDVFRVRLTLSNTNGVFLNLI